MLHPAKIIEFVSHYYGISREDILSKRQFQEYTKARHVAMALCRENTVFSLYELGYEFGRNHEIILYAHKKITSERGIYKSLDQELAELEKQIKQYSEYADNEIDEEANWSEMDVRNFLMWYARTQKKKMGKIRANMIMKWYKNRTNKNS